MIYVCMYVSSPL